MINMVSLISNGRDEYPPLGKILFLLITSAIIIWIICYAVNVE